MVHALPSELFKNFNNNLLTPIQASSLLVTPRNVRFSLLLPLIFEIPMVKLVGISVYFVSLPVGKPDAG